MWNEWGGRIWLWRAGEPCTSESARLDQNIARFASCRPYGATSLA
jgi:hypothetical protein